LTRCRNAKLTNSVVFFLDGEKPTYKPCEAGSPLVWYGLKKAVEMAQAAESPIVLCNGETSTLVAQHYDIPAFCKTGGENGNIPDDMLIELQSAWSGKVIIALDCDKQGRDAAEALSQYIPDSVVIDLGFAEHGDLADFCKLYEKVSLQYLLHLIPIKRPETMHAAIRYVLGVARGEVVDEGRILTMPYSVLHGFGGLCRYMPPGKLSLIFGMSGHGKTSFVEPMMEFWAQRGYNGIFDGREFDPDEYEFRRIQRYSGQAVEDLGGQTAHYERVTYTEFMGHKKALQEARDKIPMFLRDGQCLKGTKLRTVDWIDTMVNRWPGNLYYAPKKSYLDDTPGAELPISAEQAKRDDDYGTLTWARLYINEQRNKGIPVDYMIFDYMQLLKLHTNNAPTNAYQTALYMIKDFSVSMRIHCIVLSQVNKTNDNDSRNMNRPLPVSAMQYINDAPANLTISLNIRYVEGLETDWQGQPQMVKQTIPGTTNNPGMVWVIKNSMERTGQVKMQADLAHYRWLDLSYSIGGIDLNEDEERTALDKQIAEIGD
jgi:hypothetical protein